jgi:hypothetical protein
MDDRDSKTSAGARQARRTSAAQGRSSGPSRCDIGKTLSRSQCPLYAK